MKRKGNQVLLLIGIVILSAIGGIAGAYIVNAYPEYNPIVRKESTDEETVIKELEPFTVNLDKNGYLRITLNLVVNESDEEVLDEQTVQLRDKIIHYLTSQTEESIRETDFKENLKNTINQEYEEETGKELIKGVLITDMVSQ